MITADGYIAYRNPDGTFGPLRPLQPKPEHADAQSTTATTETNTIPPGVIAAIRDAFRRCKMNETKEGMIKDESNSQKKGLCNGDK